MTKRINKPGRRIKSDCELAYEAAWDRLRNKPAKRNLASRGKRIAQTASFGMAALAAHGHGMSVAILAIALSMSEDDVRDMLAEAATRLNGVIREGFFEGE